MALVEISLANLEGAYVNYDPTVDSFEFFHCYDLDQFRAVYIADGFTNRLTVDYTTIDPPYTWLDAKVRLVSAHILEMHGLPEGQPNPNELI